MGVVQKTGSKMEIWGWFTHCPTGKEDIIPNNRWGTLAQSGGSIVKDVSGDDLGKCSNVGKQICRAMIQTGMESDRA